MCPLFCPVLYGYHTAFSRLPVPRHRRPTDPRASSAPQTPLHSTGSDVGLTSSRVASRGVLVSRGCIRGCSVAAGVPACCGTVYVALRPGGERLRVHGEIDEQYLYYGGLLCRNEMYLMRPVRLAPRATGTFAGWLRTSLLLVVEGFRIVGDVCTATTFMQHFQSPLFRCGRVITLFRHFGGKNVCGFQRVMIYTCFFLLPPLSEL